MIRTLFARNVGVLTQWNSEVEDFVRIVCKCAVPVAVSKASRSDAGPNLAKQCANRRVDYFVSFNGADAFRGHRMHLSNTCQDLNQRHSSTSFGGCPVRRMPMRKILPLNHKTIIAVIRSRIIVPMISRSGGSAAMRFIIMNGV